MKSIRCVYGAEPTFPASDQHPDAVRYQVGDKWVDAIGYGEPPTEQEITDALGLPTAIESAWAAIKAERDRRTQTGGYAAGGKWFHSDTFSRTQQMGLVMLGANIPEGTQWKTLDGSFVTMTQTMAGQVFAAAAANDIAIFAAAEAHRAAMEQSDNPAAYDYSSGWPPAFGE